MLEEQKISEEEIIIGIPLSWDVYDNEGTLLLKKGSIIDTYDQLKVIKARGLYLAPKEIKPL